MAAVRFVSRNPAIGIAIATAVLFAIARIPTEIFYGKFAIRPEDVGLNSVQVLLQGTATVLVVSLIIAVIYGFGVPLIMLAYFVLIETLTKAPQRRRKPGLRRILRLGPILIPVLTIISALVILIGRAEQDAAGIKDGAEIGFQFMPWRAKPVNLIWSQGSERKPLPGCRWLFYLGEGNGLVVLFDSRHGQTYRINSEAVQLDFPESCP